MERAIESSGAWSRVAHRADGVVMAGRLLEGEWSDRIEKAVERVVNVACRALREAGGGLPDGLPDGG